MLVGVSRLPANCVSASLLAGVMLVRSEQSLLHSGSPCVVPDKTRVCWDVLGWLVLGGSQVGQGAFGTFLHWNQNQHQYLLTGV